MSFSDWIDKYPQVKALLQAEDDVLRYAPDGLSTPSISFGWAEWEASAEADVVARDAAVEADVKARYAAVRRALEDVRAAIQEAFNGNGPIDHGLMTAHQELSARLEREHDALLIASIRVCRC